MAQHRVAVRGSGRVELAAYGLADAERQVEKELHALWPEAAVDILELARTDPGARIVEEFAVRYRVRGAVEVEEATPVAARRAVLRDLRERFTGTRFSRIAWDLAE